MNKIIVVSATSDSDSYSSRLVQHFTKGTKAAGMEVEIISLGGKTMEEAYEIGKRMFAPPMNETPVIPQQTIKADVRVQKMVLVIGKQKLPRRQIMADLGLRQKSRQAFIDHYWRPAWEQGLIDLVHPNVPNKPEQTYCLTANGLDLYAQLTGKEWL